MNSGKEVATQGQYAGFSIYRYGHEIVKMKSNSGFKSISI
jgi:hypothetical protein